VREALRRADREDLIGYDKRCLVRPGHGKQVRANTPKNKRPKGNRRR